MRRDQRLAPVTASTAAQNSEYWPDESAFETIANARPWLMANELKPLVNEGLLQATVGPAAGQLVRIGSGETPSKLAPRYCGQSLPIASELQSASDANHN